MATVTFLEPYPGRFPSPTVRYLCRSWWTCHSAPHYTWRARSDSVLATGQPLSVVPFSIQEKLDMVLTPVPGWKGLVPTWFGVPCRIGRATLWLPIHQGPEPYRRLSLLVLLPRQDLEDTPPFVHLGTQFLLEYQAQVSLDCSTSLRPGQLVIP